jgi:hypothetical protein
VPQHVAGHVQHRALVKAAKSASIGDGAAILRTVSGSSAYGRTTVEHWAFVPFRRAGGGLNACVLKIKQLLLVECPGMGWPGGVARIAAGTMYQAHVMQGPGLVTHFNDDPAQGGCAEPTMLSLREGWCPILGRCMCTRLRARLCTCRLQAMESRLACSPSRKWVFMGKVVLWSKCNMLWQLEFGCRNTQLVHMCLSSGLYLYQQLRFGVVK